MACYKRFGKVAASGFLALKNKTFRNKCFIIKIRGIGNRKGTMPHIVRNTGVVLFGSEMR